MYRLFAFFELDKVNDEQLDFWFSCIPEKRREKALRYRREIDRKTSVISYLLLAYALFKEFNIKHFRLVYTDTGKPYLPDHPDIHFNISHCEKGCVCGISNKPIGVDIQDIRPISQAVVERCCATREQELIRQATDPADAFCRIWAMKESYLKMIGTGIVQDLARTDTTKLSEKIEVQQINGCYIAIASENIGGETDATDKTSTAYL